MSTESDTSRKGYAIFQEKIEDWDRYMEEYLPTASETIEDHGGEVIVGIPDPDIVEGEWDHSLTVVVEFPSVAAAQAWYSDPAYEEVKQIRIESSEYANAVICPGFSPEDLPG
jgi:uncharacterized protein (DUF1330 family)